MLSSFIEKPTIFQSGDSEKQILTPATCRLRNLTYSANIAVDLIMESEEFVSKAMFFDTLSHDFQLLLLSSHGRTRMANLPVRSKPKLLIE